MAEIDRILMGWKSQEKYRQISEWLEKFFRSFEQLELSSIQRINLHLKWFYASQKVDEKSICLFNIKKLLRIINNINNREQVSLIQPEQVSSILNVALNYLNQNIVFNSSN